MAVLKHHEYPVAALVQKGAFDAEDGDNKMNQALVALLLFIAGVVIYTGYRLRKLQQLSKKQWEEVDHSKLREWTDEDD